MLRGWDAGVRLNFVCIATNTTGNLHSAPSSSLLIPSPGPPGQGACLTLKAKKKKERKEFGYQPPCPGYRKKNVCFFTENCETCRVSDSSLPSPLSCLRFRSWCVTDRRATLSGRGLTDFPPHLHSPPRPMNTQLCFHVHIYS